MRVSVIIKEEARRRKKEKSAKIINTIEQKGRYINSELYRKLKNKKKCDQCKSKIKNNPEIHHIIPKRLGGSNEEDNLMSVCKGCHQMLDNKHYDAHLHPKR